MPKTVPGFLLFAGVVLLLLSFYDKPVKIWHFELPPLRKRARQIVRILSGVFLMLSGIWYGGYIAHACAGESGCFSSPPIMMLKLQ